MSSATAKLGDRSLFPELSARAYLAHAAISPPSSLVCAAIVEALGRSARSGVMEFMAFEREREGLRTRLAALIGAAPTDVALTSNTTRGVSDVALSIPWVSGQRVLLFEGEFPTNVTPWQRAAELYQLQAVFHSLAPFADGTGNGLARVEEELKRGLRVVAVSAVQFNTGLAMPILELGSLCERYGAELFVDAIQALGVLELPLARLGVHYAACGGHKWLMGPEGTGFVYVAPDSAKALRPVVAGWLSHENAEDFLFYGAGRLRYDRPFKASARVFESGGVNLYGLVGLAAALGPIEEIGVPAIQRHVSAYLDVLEDGMKARGFQSRRSPEPARRSGIASFGLPEGLDLIRLSAALKTRGVVGSTPDGLLRFAPHWPNAMGEVPDVLDAVDTAILSLR